MNWVLDCSFAAASFLPDENPILVEKFFSKLGKDITAIVPSIWWYEINNVILVSKRRKRLTEEIAEGIYSILETLQIEIDKNFSYKIMKITFDLADKYDLSIYDASYLELCKRKNSGLASFDEKLIKSAKKEKVLIFS